jgi:hypothetical protein
MSFIHASLAGMDKTFLQQITKLDETSGMNHLDDILNILLILELSVGLQTKRAAMAHFLVLIIGLPFERRFNQTMSVHLSLLSQ